MSYRVVIPTAGTGSRLASLTKYLNKSLVSIANRPTICHLIEQFPDDCEFVIPLGYKGQLVKDFLELTYPQRTFFFIEIELYEGNGSGLGLTLISCQKYLQQPFIFISCDTLVEGKIRPPDSNWMGYSKVDNPSMYRTLLIKNHLVIRLLEKESLKKEALKKDAYAYIGIAGINNYEIFWNAMNSGGFAAIEQGESYGLRFIMKNTDISCFEFNWFDTGNIKELKKTRIHYANLNHPNILEKQNEAIWFIDNCVVKYSDDKEFIENRVKRSINLKGFVPEVYDFRSNMYCYKRVEGEVLSDVVDIKIFNKFIVHCENFWEEISLNSEQEFEFNNNCLSFYQDKTLARISLFYKNFNKKDNAQFINDQEMPTLSNLFKKIDWSLLSQGIPGRFHGDFHFENILWSKENESFTFLDWRQDFSGNTLFGDIYYDFAKLMHGLIVNHGVISRNKYSASWKNNEIYFEIQRKKRLIESENEFNNWLKINGFDLKKVRILTALIYLNIAALHHHPYSLLLYGLGKEMLYKELI